MGTHFCIFNKIRYALIAAICIGPVTVNAAGVLSQYGQIQNVQNYSSNPFWSPNSAYNQKFPQPVYALGPDVSTDDCISVVSALVAAQCTALNRCVGKQLSDIRPAVMLELSRLPGKNFATACAGYIDTAFAQYTGQMAGTVTPTAFPAATQPVEKPAEFKIQNPFPTPELPEWKKEMKEREEELRQLQS